ncbi:MAG: CRISPR-associated endonuclease Cas1 [Myxococcales bacterium]|nr:CRISPR-associated endonuclease Cas1 [Myxococcales bacterium]
MRDTPLVPARMVNEVLYCERLMAIEWVFGESAPNEWTADGSRVHRRVDTPGYERREGPEGEVELRTRAVWLSDEQLGVTARIDLLRETPDGVAVPVDTKRGRSPDVEHGAWLPERAQVCAQALLLRSQGYACEWGELYFVEDKRRVRVELTDELVATTLQAIARARQIFERRELPAPLENSPKCEGCSLSGICLPDETRTLMASAAPADVRRLFTARDDRQAVYVQTVGARVGVSQECLTVKSKEGSTEVRFVDTSQVCLYGPVQISSQAIRAVLDREIPVCFFSMGGWYQGRTQDNGWGNVETRRRQYRCCDDDEFRLRQAGALVANKIANQRTLLRRNGEDVDDVALGELKRLAASALRATALAEVLGIEGAAARLYFSNLHTMLRPPAPGASLDFDWNGRHRRPSPDPVNALLSWLYGVLAKDCALAAAAVGLDPLLGFYHRPRPGRPALALDLMEPFRPLIADSVAITLVNGGTLDAGDFKTVAGACALTDAGRRKALSAYERRMEQLVTHPRFDYRLSYRRILEVQARFLVRVMTGELDLLPEMRTR